jgi:hypothetical protein
MKKEVTIILGILLVLTTITTASAYKWICLGKNEPFPPPSTRECEHDVCQICVTDDYIYTHFGNCRTAGPCEYMNGTHVDSEPPNITVNSPTQDSVYNSRSVLFEVETDERCSMYYTDTIQGRGRWKRVCSKCKEYSHNRRFDEGLNNITIKCRDLHGNEAEVQKQFRVDSRGPRIKSLTDEDFASGHFAVEIDEENPKEIWVNYGNMQTGWRSAKFSLGDCYEERNDMICETNADLADYDEQTVQFWFNITDIAGNSDETKVQEAKVDNKPPVINSLNYEKDRRRVTFYINITEKNFDEITYSYMDDRGRTRTGTLCRRLENGICEDRTNFRDGFNNVTITVRDEAGNTATETAAFYIDSKAPRITGTEPRRGYANGNFEVEFIEETPVLLTLQYGTQSDMRAETLDLNQCWTERNKQKCETNADLTDYNGKEITYWFTLKDYAGNTEDSRENELDVDTEFPILNNPTTFWTQGTGRHTQYIYFNFSITEPNFEEIQYYDHSDNRPRWKRLCTRLREGICEERERFREGQHTVDIQITDEAGNSIAQRIEFTTPE